MRSACRVLIVWVSIIGAATVNAQSSDLKHPDWHPDGRLLISEGSCRDGIGLYLIDTKTGDVSLLFDSEYSDGYPRWFSNGERITLHSIKSM